jgi:hypothetical protein
MNPLFPIAALGAEPFQVGHPLFGNQWLALLAASGLIVLLLAAVALLGRWLAATHPDAPAKAASATVAVGTPSVAGALAVSVAASAPLISGEVPAELVPVIVAAIAATLGAGARVASIKPYTVTPVPMPSLEALMQQWSYEGRRQIYSSHKVR